LGKEVLEEEFNFATRVSPDVSGLKGGIPDEQLRIRDWVLALDKPGLSEGTARIFLGRASNNDLVVPHATVSKLHAYFCKES